MQSYTIKEGQHHVYWPRVFKIILYPQGKSFKWKIRFHENCRYIFPLVDGKVDEDQRDWNKICGIDMDSIFSTMKYTVMGGWRYNPDTKRIELNAYFHDGLGTSNRTMSKTLMTCLPNEDIELEITILEEKWSVTYTNSKEEKITFTLYPSNGRKKFKFATEINWYFGGNRVAPQDVTVFKKSLK